MKITVKLLRDALEQASLRSGSLNLPEELPALLVAEGIWSPQQALDRIEGAREIVHAGALERLAPFLSAPEALAALKSAECTVADFSFVRGVAALARRLIDLGAADRALAALSRLGAGPRGLAIARVIHRLPKESQKKALGTALKGFDVDHCDGCLTYLLLARATPNRRDELITRGVDVLWSPESPDPHVLVWLAIVDSRGARARAVAFARARERPSEKTQALAAVLPYCKGDERRALWSEWRAALEQALAAGHDLVSLGLPLPARDDELAELRAIFASLATRTSPRERAVALARIAVHHPALVDEALVAVRQLAGLERGLGLLSLLPALPESTRPAVAREALPLLVCPGGEPPDGGSPEGRMISEFYENWRDWPRHSEEPPLDDSEPTPQLTNLRARAIAALAPGERRSEALLLLAEVLKIYDAHHRAGALAALGSRIADPTARAAALEHAESVALASTRPWIGLLHLLRRVEAAARPGLARRALAALPERIDADTAHHLAPLLEALPPDEAAALFTRVVKQHCTGSVNDMEALCAAALRAGAVRPLAELLLAKDDHSWDEKLLPQLLRYADAELRPRIVASLLSYFEPLYQLPDILEAIPWLTPAECLWIAERMLEQDTRGGKLSFRLEPLLLALARPLVEQGAIERLRQLLADIKQQDRLTIFASVLPSLAAKEREAIVRQILADIRGGDRLLAYKASPHLAAAGHAAELLDVLPQSDATNLVRIAPHVPAELRPRLLELLAQAVVGRRSGVGSSAGIHGLAPLLPELPRKVVAHLCKRVLADEARQGRAALFRAFIRHDVEDVPQTGLLLGLAELAGDDLPACLAEIEAIARRLP